MLNLSKEDHTKLLKLIGLYNIRNCNKKREIDLTCRLGDCRDYYECKIIKQQLYKLIQKLEEELSTTPAGELAVRQARQHSLSKGTLEMLRHDPAALNMVKRGDLRHNNFQEYHSGPYLRERYHRTGPHFRFYPRNHYAAQQQGVPNYTDFHDDFGKTMSQVQEAYHGSWGMSIDYGKPYYRYKDGLVHSNRCRPKNFLHQSDVNEPLLSWSNLNLVPSGSGPIGGWAQQNQLRNAQIDKMLSNPQFLYSNPHNSPVNQHYHNQLNIDDSNYLLRTHNFEEPDELKCF